MYSVQLCCDAKECLGLRDKMYSVLYKEEFIFMQFNFAD